MERGSRKIPLFQRKSKNKDFEEGRPLKHLNGLQIDKSNTKKGSNLSSSSSSSSASAAVAASASIEAPEGCLRFLVPSNTCTASSSCSRTRLDRKQKTLSTATSIVSKKSTPVASKMMPGSKENEVPIKPFSDKSKKKQPPGPSQKEFGKTNTKPTNKNVERSKFFSGQGNPVNKLKKGSQELKATRKSSENDSGQSPLDLFGVSNQSNLNYLQNCTPGGKIASGCGLDSIRFDDNANVREDSVLKADNGNSATSVKTPPIEASVSPEIQCGSQSKMLLCKSAATPVCYGAGHLLSGVTDKRKCRRIGSLKGGCEKVNLFDDEKNDGNVIIDSQDSTIPLLAEASVRWLLSPCDEGGEDQGHDSENRLDKCKMVRGYVSPTLDLLSSPLTLSGNVSDLGCDNANCNGSGGVDDVASKRKARITVVSHLKDPEFQGLLGNSNKKKHESLLAATPNSTSNCMGERKIFGQNVIENNSELSLGSFSSGNIIQTPNSGSSSDGCIGKHHWNFAPFEPRSEMSMLDAPSKGFQFADMNSSSSCIGLAQLQKNVDSVCSWVSDSTLDNFSLSQTRISWRDGLVSRIDEFDCCQCLSDEEIDAIGSSDEQVMLHPLSQSGGDKGNDQGIKSCLRSNRGTESKANEENDLGIGSDISPILLEHEPCISAQQKENSSPRRPNTCAESISTNGGDLVTSGDSDCTYFWEITRLRSNMD